MKTIPFDKKVWCDMTFDNKDIKTPYTLIAQLRF